MSDEQPSRAGAPTATAILVGGPGAAPGFDARHHASVLWFVDAVGALLPLPDADATVVHTIVLDGLTAAAARAALERFHQRDPFGMPRLFVSRDFPGGDRAPHAGVLAQVRSWCVRLTADAALVQRVGFTRQKNLLLNVPEYIRRQIPAAWAGALRGVPAFVCGAGPSLDVSVAALAAVADRGVVFAADSALRALARHGIVADFAVSMLSRRSPERCLTPGSEPARVIVSNLSPASWREAIAPERLYFLSRPHPTEDWLADLGLPPAPVIAAENCGITVLELARFLGCAPIHLFGLDLALDPVNPAAHHSADADLGPERNELAAVAALPRVPGNYAVEVPTFLHADWSACDARLATWPENLVINVNDRGARLRGTRLVHPRQFALAGGGVAKRSRVAQLAVPAVADVDAARRALAALGAQGARGCRMIADWRACLAQRGPRALCLELQRAFTDHDFARALGSFTQKLLPHVAAVTPDEAFWSEALDECEELCCLAEAVYGVPVA